MLEVADGSEGPEDSSHRDRFLRMSLNHSIHSDFNSAKAF